MYVFTGIGVGRVCSFRPLELEQCLILLCLYLQALELDQCLILLCLYLQALELEQCLMFLTAEIDKDEMWNGANTTMREAAQV